MVAPDSPAALINRELSWLSFAHRVLALAADPEQPLLERVKFAGIMGMIYDEFAMTDRWSDQASSTGPDRVRT
jgi:polyphosphate kinase